MAGLNPREWFLAVRYLHRACKARWRDERAELRALLAAVAPGDTVADIGANKGAFCYWLARRVGPAGRVYAFEPQRPLAVYLRRVFGTLRLRQIEVVECAVSDYTGEAILHVPGTADSPGASLDAGVLAEQEGHRASCRVGTLDDLLADASRVTALKIDVEGNEWAVFKGASRILERQRPLLLFECEARHLRRHRMEDVLRYLEDRGYRGSFFAPDGALRPVAEFDPSVHQRADRARFWDAPDYCNNFLYTAR